LFQGPNFHIHHDLNDMSVQSKLTPRGYNNDDKQLRFNDTFDEDLSQQDLKDHMFIDLMGGGGVKSLRNSYEFQNDENGNVKSFPKDIEENYQPKFYEEKIEDESYDHELIEELFNSKKKVKISKSQVEKLQQQNRASSDDYQDSLSDLNQLTGFKSKKRDRKHTVRDTSPFSD